MPCKQSAWCQVRPHPGLRPKLCLSLPLSAALLISVLLLCHFVSLWDKDFYRKTGGEVKKGREGRGGGCWKGWILKTDLLKLSYKFKKSLTLAPFCRRRSSFTRRWKMRRIKTDGESKRQGNSLSNKNFRNCNFFLVIWECRLRTTKIFSERFWIFSKYLFQTRIRFENLNNFGFQTSQGLWRWVWYFSQPLRWDACRFRSCQKSLCCLPVDWRNQTAHRRGLFLSHFSASSKLSYPIHKFMSRCVHQKFLAVAAWGQKSQFLWVSWKVGDGAIFVRIFQYF